MNLVFHMMPCAVLLLFVLLAGCAASSQSVSGPPSPVLDSVAGSPSVKSVSNLPSSDSDLEKLAAIWAARSKQKAASDFPVGVGDLLEISVPAIEELRSRTVRIAGDGTIALPFIGKVEAAGLIEEELQQKIVERLKQYMYSPRVIVFVKEYRSRQVAVLGAVGRPGLYNLSNGSDTLLDVLSQAGGITAGADSKIYFIPAEPVESGKAAQIISSLPQAVLQQDPTPMILKRTDPILIDMKQLAFGGSQQYLSIAARPGDIIMVPGGGQVLVEGWVEKPGAYPVSPGLTVAGVVVQAGGPMYPADVTSVKVIRSERGGGKITTIADLEKIKRGETADIPLQGGDIVEVSHESSKLIAYGLYRFFSTAVHLAIGGNIPIFK
jgi:polysaccharide export outer membrane protein